MVSYTQTTLQKEGMTRAGDITYGVSVTAKNGKLERLYCGITRQATARQEGGDVPAPVDNANIGYIALTNGKQVVEVTRGEDIVPHLAMFKEISDEVQKDLEANAPKK